MSWLGDVFSFENFNAKKWGEQLKDNPLRLFYGSADPFSTKVWNGILGTHDKPMVDQFGGAPKQRYEEAQQAGINTGPGGTMHGIARTIAGAYAGGYGANALGGAGSVSGGAGNGISGSIGSTGTEAAGMGGSLGNGLSGGITYGEAGMANGMSGGLGSGISGSIPTNQGLLATANGSASQIAGNSGSWMDYAKNASEAMKAANSAKSIFQTQEKPVQPSPIMQNAPNNQLGLLVTSLQNEESARDTAEQQKRAARKQMIRSGLL